MTLKYSRSQHVCGRLYCVVQDEECTGGSGDVAAGYFFKREGICQFLSGTFF